MSYDYSATLNKEKALIWRIVHRDNLPWILSNGLHCGNSLMKADNWINIGHAELITKRGEREVVLGVEEDGTAIKQGVLNDYVPFYFTPFSPMMLNIRSGRGVPARPNDEIVILVSSLHDVVKAGLPFVFTDHHAYCFQANFYTDLNDLENIDWDILQARDFRRDPDDLGKFERYQAEALILGHCPVSVLHGLICYSESVQSHLAKKLEKRGLTLPVHIRKEWYF